MTSSANLIFSFAPLALFKKLDNKSTLYQRYFTLCRPLKTMCLNIRQHVKLRRNRIKLIPKITLKKECTTNLFFCKGEMIFLEKNNRMVTMCRARSFAALPQPALLIPRFSV